MLRKKKRILAALLVVVLALAGAGLLAAGQVRQNRTVIRSSEAKGNAELKKERTADGKRYVYNDHLSSYLFLGIDDREMQETETGHSDAGQSDALYLAVWDRKEHTVTRINIPRDTMTEIEAFSYSGKSLGLTVDHISLAYGFGDGKHKSCQLSREAVSRLLGDIPIQGYCAVGLDALGVLSEAVGDVTVTVPDDSLETANPSCKAGTELVLDGTNTEQFVRYRNTQTSQSAISRLRRQEIYLNACGAKIKEEASRDAGFLADLYGTLEPYLVTNMGNDEFVKLAEQAFAGTMREWTIPGEGTQGKSYDEYHVEEKVLEGKVLETFYQEVN